MNEKKQTSQSNDILYKFIIETQNGKYGLVKSDNGNVRRYADLERYDINPNEEEIIYSVK